MPDPTPLEEIGNGYVALGLEVAGHLFLGSRPPDQGPPCTTFILRQGYSHPTLPLEDLVVDVYVEGDDAGVCYAKARQAYAALHQKTRWLLVTWEVMLALVDGEPVMQMPDEGSAERVYAATFRVRMKLKHR